jgi:hypothetical protein
MRFEITFSVTTAGDVADMVIPIRFEISTLGKTEIPLGLFAI